MDTICIMGAGSWGSALALLLNNNGHKVNLYVRNESQANEMINTNKNSKYLGDIIIPSEINIFTDLDSATKDASVIVLAVSSQATRAAVLSLQNKISSKVILVNVSKGLEKGTNKRISEVVGELLPSNSFVVLSGPSHAEEVAVKMPTTVVAASENIEAAEYIQDIFSSEFFRVYTNPDVIGVELGGALKNIIAFGSGIIDGLGYGDNTKAGIMTRGLAEIARLGVALGADISTFAGLSGIGDLIVTCTSMHSRNRRAGIMIGQGKTLEETLAEIQMVVEGITATEVAYNLALEKNIDMPITAEIYKVLYEGKDIKETIKSLMTRTKKHETEDLIHLKYSEF
ncbi:NAD(P)H-dependent glycerol-3-phosphate dehydrogenase [Acetoanaerobium noterae]|uniref:NAD(P)H-dependent glycerol-3-phosphate dehydrogenase n=1 Tax=Acetoanaerobium noterae TaxID=745369 RepID=UPI003221608D